MDSLCATNVITTVGSSLKARHERNPICCYGSECTPNTVCDNNGGGGKEHSGVEFFQLSPLFSIKGHLKVHYQAYAIVVMVTSNTIYCIYTVFCSLILNSG